jgi:FtsZ-binding cell division protein ZapB
MPKSIAQEVATMQYKTITLELIQENPSLYEKLRSSRMLRPAMEAYANYLKVCHEAWKERIGQTMPGSDPTQIAAEALERAVAELRESLPYASVSDEAEPLSLDAAMNSIRRHTPPA